MRVAFVTAGAAGMFCGSCMRDNTLVAALSGLGHDAHLIPTYTPIRTDEVDVSEGRVFYGGVAVYLEQKSRLFRHTPRFVDWLLNRPGLLRWVSARFAGNFDYGSLGELAASMLQGDHGRQRKELAPLVAWLKTDLRPEVVILTNALLSGMVPPLAGELRVPVLVTLQGDDIFLDALPAKAKSRCLGLIRENDRSVAGYVCTSREYADHMAGYLGVDRGKMHVVYPGINLKGHGVPVREPGRPPTVGYFARICPEKGFQNIVETFIHLRNTPGVPRAKLRAAGWLGAHHRAFFDAQVKKLAAAGLADDFEHVDCPDHASKVRFLQSIDVLSVPTTYREPKGLYVLEAWANGVPVVQPRHGSFPELIEGTNAGTLYDPGDTAGHTAALRSYLDDPPKRDAAGRRGRRAVEGRFTAAVMAAETLKILDRYVTTPAPALV